MMTLTNRGVELKIQLETSVLAISIGHGTDWFKQVPFILIAEEDYDPETLEVVYATHIWDSRRRNQ